MGLRPYFRSVRIWKRSALKKPRPSWSSVVAGGKSYAIAAKNQKAFKSAFIDAVRSMLRPKDKAAFSEAWKSGSLIQVMNSLPLFNDGASGQSEAYQEFSDKIRTAYTNVMQQTADAEAEQMARRFKRKPIFIFKASAVGLAGKTSRAVGNRLIVQTVPVNPKSLAWINQRGLQLVKEGISAQQKLVVRSIIETGFSMGLHPSVAFDSIKANIGLTMRDFEAVLNRVAALEEQGYQQGDINDEAAAYTDELLGNRAENIARTETIYAESQGRLEAWKSADEAGMLPQVQRVWMAPPPSANPNSPCALCLSLDGMTAPLDGFYESEETDEPIPAPPAHPQCGCTETIVEVSPEEAAGEESAA